MPELPEVETVVRSLNKSLSDSSIKKIKVYYPKIISENSLSHKKIINNKILSVSRKAKYIIINLEINIIAVHLRMTGKLYTESKSKSKSKHIHAVFELTDGRKLIYEDVRKFGRISFLKDLSYIKQKLGIEPLSDEFSYHWCKENFKKKHRQIKSLLLDQSFIAGLGNIYIDEVLWDCKIHPLQIASKLKNNKLFLLHQSIKNILQQSIRYHGTTIRDFVFEGFKIGEYTKQLKVFNKQDSPCQRCNTNIVKIKIASRGTHICLKCQKLYD